MTEEFTFPISTNTSGAFIDSPPLWQHVGSIQATSTSSNSSSFSEEEEETQRKVSHPSHTLQRKSFSCLEGGIRNHNRSMEFDDVHDRMDLLWEDFNEELTPRNRNSFVCHSDDDHGEFSELGCVPAALKGSARNRGDAGGGRVVIPKNKKLRMVVLGKVIKRLFLLQHQSVKKRSW